MHIRTTYYNNLDHNLHKCTKIFILLKSYIQFFKEMLQSQKTLPIAKIPSTL